MHQPIGLSGLARAKRNSCVKVGRFSTAWRAMVPQGERPKTPRGSRRRLALRLLAAGLGVAAGMGTVNLLWPEADRAAKPEDIPTAKALAEVPSQAITVLLIGSDADRPGTVRNDAAPLGPANSDALLLVEVNPKGPVQVLTLPIETAVQLPGDQKPVALGSLYRRGGPALVAGAVAALVDLPQGQPQRYLVLPRSTLRTLVDDLGRVEIAPDRTMNYTDKAQKLTIKLEGGLQWLGGDQLEQLVRFRDKERGEEGRRERQQLTVESLLKQMGHPQQLQQLPNLIAKLQNQVDTNLSQGEVLSLLAAALQQSQPVRFRSLPLNPPLKPGEPLRQLAPEARDQPWPN
jgi:LCP family protein required for cell wall assembly